MIGSNVPTVGGLSRGFGWAGEWGCESIQIYVTLSRRWAVRDLSDQDITSFRDAWKASPVRQVVAHVPFLVNLASANDEIWSKSVGRLSVELRRANQLGVSYLVLHPGSQPDQADGISRVVLGINQAMRDAQSRHTQLLLETMAGQGASIGSRFEQIAEILDRLNSSSSVGVCLDTCHLFAAGYDIRTDRGLEGTLAHFDDVVGLERIRAMHFNDSKAPYGSRIDRHAPIGEGQLGLYPFRALLKDTRFSQVPKILEIPERDSRSKDNLELLRRLRASPNVQSERTNVS